MSRTINVQIMTDHDDTDQALRSVISNLKRAGYEYVDYKILTRDEEPHFTPIEVQSNALLAMVEPDHEEVDKLPLGNAEIDPTL